MPQHLCEFCHGARRPDHRSVAVPGQCQQFSRCSLCGRWSAACARCFACCEAEQVYLSVEFRHGSRSALCPIGLCGNPPASGLGACLLLSGLHIEFAFQCIYCQKHTCRENTALPHSKRKPLLGSSALYENYLYRCTGPSYGCVAPHERDL